MRVRPTTRGVAMLLATAALVVLAYGTRQTALLVPAGLTAGTLLVGPVLALLARPSRTVRWEQPQVGTEGTTHTVAFGVDHAFAEGSWRAPTSLQPRPFGWWAFDGEPIGEIELHDAPRGVHTLGPVRARRRDPLGVVVVSQRLGHRHEALVGPRIVPLAADTVLGHGLEAAAQRMGAGDVVDQLVRDYRAGDPMRRIHWRQSAHHDRLMVRQEVPPSTPQAIVVLDTLASGYASIDELDEAVRAFASIASAMVGQGLGLHAIETGRRQLTGDAHLGTVDGLRAACARITAVDEPGTPAVSGAAIVVLAAGSPQALELVDGLEAGSSVWAVTDAPVHVPAGVRLVRWRGGRPVDDRSSR